MTEEWKPSRVCRHGTTIPMASDNPEAHCSDCLADEIESWQDELERPEAPSTVRLAEEHEIWGVKERVGCIEVGAGIVAEAPSPLALCKHDQPLNYYCAACASEGRKVVGTRHLFDHKERKERPLARGVLDYFPDALLEVAHCSYVGNEQHNPGQPVHWAKGKSTDEADALLRHLIDRGTNDSDGVRHSAKVAWRALALLQREIDAEREGKS